MRNNLITIVAVALALCLQMCGMGGAEPGEPEATVAPSSTPVSTDASEPADTRPTSGGTVLPDDEF